MTKTLLLSLILAAFVNACARQAPPQSQTVLVNSSCGPRPASWPNSQMRVAPGKVDTALDARTGALVVALSIDSMPRVNKAQVSLLYGTKHYDAIYGDTLIKITAPAGRYLFRAREIGAQTIQDSVDVRGNFADTVKVTLGREVVCLDVHVTG